MELRPGEGVVGVGFEPRVALEGAEVAAGELRSGDPNFAGVELVADVGVVAALGKGALTGEVGVVVEKADGFAVKALQRLTGEAKAGLVVDAALGLDVVGLAGSDGGEARVHATEDAQPVGGGDVGPDARERTPR